MRLAGFVMQRAPETKHGVASGCGTGASSGAVVNADITADESTGRGLEYVWVARAPTSSGHVDMLKCLVGALEDQVMLRSMRVASRSRAAEMQGENVYGIVPSCLLSHRSWAGGWEGGRILMIPHAIIVDYSIIVTWHPCDAGKEAIDMRGFRMPGCASEGIDSTSWYHILIVITLVLLRQSHMSCVHWTFWVAEHRTISGTLLQ